MNKWMRAVQTPLVMCLVLGNIVFAGILALRATGALEFLELAGFDLYLRLRPEVTTPDARIVLLGATEADLQSQGWPLSDRILAKLLERVAVHRPQAIGVDLYRDRPVPPGGTQLRRFLEKNNETIFVM